MTSPRPHTYARLVELVFRQLAQAELLPPDARWPDAGTSHRASAQLKLDILARAYERAGPGPILRVGEGILCGGTDPMVRVLLTRRSPIALAQTFCRLEVYGHSVNRTTIVASAPGSLSIARFKLGGGAPTFVENLLIVGLIKALLASIGARDVTCEVALRGAADVLWSCRRAPREPEKTQPIDPLDRREAVWTLSWSAFASAAPPRQPATTELVQEMAARDRAGLVCRLIALIADDPGRSYQLADAAKALALSTRTLQRHLAAAGTTFASITRRVRVSAALSMIAERQLPLALIACACGFADSAHLSRDVRRVVGAPPSELRALLRA